MQQRVDEIRTEPERHEQANDWVRHGRASQPVAKEGVRAHQRETAQAEGKKYKVKHCEAFLHENRNS